MSTFAPVVRISSVAVSLLLATAAYAAPPTKEECVDAHGKGQDAREAGQLTRAGKLFLTCAQPACPALVQSDCARFAEELERLQPTVTFAARDGAQNDLPDTAVLVDGALVTSRLGDGKAYELDPGAHAVRFVHAGKETVLEVVVNQGEKGRGLVGVFPSPIAAAPPSGAPSPLPSPSLPAAPAPEAPAPKRPAGPLVLVGLGAAAAVAGGVVFGVGLAKIPARCSLAAKQCAAPPGDPLFAQASSGVTTANLGAIVGGAGLATLAGSLIWYFAQSPRSAEPAAAVLTPWAGPEGAGLSLTGAL